MPNTYIDPSMIPQLLNYYQNSIGTTGGPSTTKGSSGFGLGSAIGAPILDILGGNLSSLFGGGDKQTFKPYTNAQGQLVWTDPKTSNPVPLSNVPGANLVPGKPYQQVANQGKILTDLLPYLSAAVNREAVPNAQANLAASEVTSKGNADLMTQIYNQYGPLLNQIGNKIQEENALSQAGTTNKVLEGPGAQTVQDTLALQKQVDPEYYATRAANSSAINNLLSQLGNINQGPSSTENRQIGQGLAREGAQRGTANAPSASDTVANAMQYGQAGFARRQANITNLSNAIQSASAFLPSSKSGIDAFQTATGRTSMSNPGGALFPGTMQSNNPAFGLAGNLLGGVQNSQITGMNIQANQKDWLDKFNQLTSGIGNIVGTAGKVGGMVGGL